MELKPQPGKENRVLSKKYYVWTGIIFLIGITITLVIYTTQQKTLEARQQELVSRVHMTVYNSIQREIDRNLDALLALKTSFVAHRGMSRAQFSIYARHYLQYLKSIQALEWVPHVLHKDRDSLEQAARRDGFAGFQIIQRAGDRSVRAEDRREYFPVYYLEPFEGNENAMGFDPGQASIQRWGAIEKAIQSGAAAASHMMTLIQDKDQQHAMLVFVPIMNHELDQAGDKEINSLVEGVYLVEKLIAAALSDYKIPNTIVATIYEKENPAQIIYSNAPNKGAHRANEALVKTIKMANREWILTTTTTGENVFAVINPYWLLILGFVLTTLICVNVFRFLTDNKRELVRYAKMLEVKNKELEQYAYVAAHDLQEPLHTMSSLVTLLKEDCGKQLPEQGKTYLDFIEQAAERMSSLIQDLLNYSRIGRQEAPQRVDCNVLLQHVTSDLQQRIQQTHTRIHYSALPTVLGYPTALRQLFHNLITNAIKFQPPGQNPEIRIDATKLNEGWMFSVKDNGIGIPQEQQESVFVLFKRLHRKDKYAGNGIGLTYCRKAVEMHHGEIWIDSAPGEGSTFTFIINLE